MTFKQKNKVVFGDSLNSGGLRPVLKAHIGISYPLHFFLQQHSSLLRSSLVPVGGQITSGICQFGERIFVFVTSDNSTSYIKCSGSACGVFYSSNREFPRVNV